MPAWIFCLRLAKGTDGIGSLVLSHERVAWVADQRASFASQHWHPDDRARYKLSFIEEEHIVGMSNNQYQGFIRGLLAIAKLAEAESPENQHIKILVEMLQAMLEDGN